MQRLGFIHDMLDVKVLILFVASQSDYPMTMQEIYELSFQDECLSYFDVCTAVPEMVVSGHLREVGADRYAITDKGREQGEVTADSVAYTVRVKVLAAVDTFNQKKKHSNSVITEILGAEESDLSVRMTLDNGTGKMMVLDLPVPNRHQAEHMAHLMQKKGENLYHVIMGELLRGEESSGK